MESKKLAIVCVVCLLVGYFVHDAMQPKRPFLTWLGRAVRTAIWVAPLVLDEPQQEMRFQTAVGNYGDLPARPEAQDGYAVVEHGENW